ncbi:MULTISPECIES: aldehyde dehydrogenase family protein [Nocardiaceae]|uniref:Aldehyde dehydrogenase n=1 Tax=Rhodococcoides corynebacterioides TaxID=53972 RepID=A0ABS2KNB3_9NOCA|nr:MULTISPECIES: aldehyde dehydrogenase family protein [Rhodococcus]MBM7413298.1 coniferyl-aldehyde dehydrogenase [Rhodococcus corynebacterioides]MBP1115761.1 coniferyl-aldehyde dehydrogenase [Rhodococcus sp. PvP016]
MTTTLQPREQTVADLRPLFDAQRSAHLREGPPSIEVRKDRLNRLLAAVLGASDDLAEAMSADFGHRPLAFSLSADVVGAVDHIAHLKDSLENWMTPVVVAGSAEAGIPTEIDAVPLGVVGVVGPWNFPVSLVVHPAAEAIAAGNRVMIKFSDGGPRAGAVLSAAVSRYFDPSELVVVTGGLDVAAAFSSLPFGHLFFTGSPAVGTIVQRAAAENLTPVTLELGGKNPAVVAEDADIEEAARRIAGSRMSNGGQVCLCPDYVFVQASRVDELVAALTSSLIALHPHYSTDTAVTSIVDDRNFRRVTGLIADAVAKGARAVEAVPEDERALLPDPDTRRIAPTILLDVTDEMDVAGEEVFGPVLTVMPYSSMDEVIEYIATRPSPLVAYWYGDNSPSFRQFRSRTISGGISLNDFAVHAMLPDIPFGGVGRSGMGSYHGKAGFDTFSHHRAVASSEIPGGVVGMIGPPSMTAEAAADIRGRIAHAHSEVLREIGR